MRKENNNRRRLLFFEEITCGGGETDWVVLGFAAAEAGIGDISVAAGVCVGKPVDDAAGAVDCIEVPWWLGERGKRALPRKIRS